MAEIKHVDRDGRADRDARADRAGRIGAAELRDLRAWRALLIEAHGVVRDLRSLEFALTLPAGDVLSMFGLGGSVWARERWAELRAALDEPVEPSGSDEAPELAAA